MIRYILFLSLLVLPTRAFSHSIERGWVMLLPTDYYIWGAAVSVAASFALLVFIPAHWLKRKYAQSVPLFSLPTFSSTAISCISFLFLIILVYVGFTGSQDPIKNILPLTIWTGWWIGFTLLQFFFGNLWYYINPWRGPVRVIQKYLRLKSSYIAFPCNLAYYPALLLFFSFAWFELIDLAPENPHRLAIVVAMYWTINFFAILLFGEKHWLNYAEPFSIFFKLIGKCAFIRLHRMPNQHRKPKIKFALCWLGSNLPNQPTLPWAGVLFVILTLSTITFDGLSKTFFWLDLFDINPLAFPGRSHVMSINTIGILLSFALLSIFYIGCVGAGKKLIAQRGGRSIPPLYGDLIYSFIPISLAFHFSHFLTALLVNGQYLINAFNDPFNRGWNLFGLHDYHVTTSFLNDIHAVSVIWTMQTVIIIVGHVIGIITAHVISLRRLDETDEKTASLLQLFLAFLMVGYTVLGLWLLSTASIL